MGAPPFQVTRERALRAELDASKEVQYALRKVEEVTSGFGFIGRRRLLTGALRLTRTMAPEVADTLARCRETLGFKDPVEVYVRPDPMLGASCAKAAAGPVLLVLTSRLMEVLTPEELTFVVGHEIGHARLDHFGLPMPLTATIEDVAGTLVSRPMALKLFLWCRAAELSADRAGLLCARDPVAAASGFFKIASGLSSPRVRADLEAYATQVASLASAPEARKKPRDNDDTLDCFSTHPYSPVRVRAVVAYARSRSYLQQAGLPVPDDALSDEQVDAIVERDLALMEPSYLEEKSADATFLRRLLYCGGVSVAAASGAVEPSEERALRALLGHDHVEGPIDVPAARKELDAKCAEAVTRVGLAGRAQLVQHLTIVAAADGVVDDHELAEMTRIAGQLGVLDSVVTETLRGAHAPMD